MVVRLEEMLKYRMS